MPCDGSGVVSIQAQTWKSSSVEHLSESEVCDSSATVMYHSMAHVVKKFLYNKLAAAGFGGPVGLGHSLILKELDDLWMALFFCMVKSRLAVGVRDVHVGAFFHQELNGF